MKKLMLIAASALFMITGCDENKAEKTADVKTAAPVVNQTAPAAQPGPNRMWSSPSIGTRLLK